ncbi:alpha/beta fold hydrolase BchO [Actibacterium sp. 188UL27-1]|uniref:alpha/beta fold hydrolase BchO n=1 Tax=Actibacterium sp. 188UL27-1 TaxID=2786961 RepID=UPI00195DA9B1|nr:alpha/beta fold hydrolase BchO [Actibacterium sp. 188UL27-1]MBM7070013.1 alpha/beta fold hydrolase [Actibacterium sp. 188UL27-1]
MDWEAYAAVWPNASFSQFVPSRPHRWHVQTMGEGPTVLLLHGAGGATHSWRDLMPLLAQKMRVVAPDLPGHAFTKLGALQRSSLPLMARDVAGLLTKLEVTPDIIIGHSAGCALGLQMLDLLPDPPKAVVGINPALDNFKGVAGWLFPAMAKALALNPLVAPAFARMTRNGSAENLIASTGSTLDPVGLALYRAAIGETRHVDGTLTMMAQWKLDGLRQRLPHIAVPSLFIVGDNDQAVPPATADQAALRMPKAQVMHLPRLGHLAHEEAPADFAEIINTFVADIGLKTVA